MSRYWEPSYNGWRPKTRSKPRSPEWEKARQKRAERRSGAPLQNRNGDGFIIKTGSDGGTYLHDPGVIDRYLYLKSERDRD